MTYIVNPKIIWVGIIVQALLLLFSIIGLIGSLMGPAGERGASGLLFLVAIIGFSLCISISHLRMLKFHERRILSQTSSEETFE